MLPVALMAFMGLLLGLGSSFSSPTTIDAFPFLGNSILQVVFKYMSTIGGFAFNNLAVMFAMAIPLGLAKKEKGVAAFSGFVGYMVMNLAINFYLGLTNQLADADVMQKAGQSLVLGVQTIEMGVLGGIITGIIVYNLNKKYCTIQLPDSFAFFGGARLVPIITSLVMAVVGIILPIIWPVFAFLINGVGALIHGAGPFGPCCSSRVNDCCYHLDYTTFSLPPSGLPKQVAPCWSMVTKFRGPSTFSTRNYKIICQFRIVRHNFYLKERCRPLCSVSLAQP